MKNNNNNLFNAVVIAENPDAAFIVVGNRLHAVDQRVAEQQKEKSKPEIVLPLILDALKALIQFADGKVKPHLTEEGTEALTELANQQQELIGKIQQIHIHLSHHDRNHLSSLIHHSQTVH